MTEAKAVRIACDSCNQQTNHRKLYSVEVESDEQAEYKDHNEERALEIVTGYSTYDVLQCMGCNTVTFSHRLFVPDFGYDQTDFYPPRMFRRLPKWHKELSTELAEILRQVYAALQNGHGALALMGARTIVDMVMLDKVGDKGSFTSKLTALYDAGLTSAKGKDVLLVALDAGSAAAHRGYNPNPEVVGEVMDIVENLLEATYRLDALAERLKKATPSRNRPH